MQLRKHDWEFFPLSPWSPSVQGLCTQLQTRKQLYWGNLLEEACLRGKGVEAAGE